MKKSVQITWEAKPTKSEKKLINELVIMLDSGNYEASETTKKALYRSIKKELGEYELGERYEVYCHQKGINDKPELSGYLLATIELF